MSRTAWIIGASTGIGAALAIELEKRNYKVVRSSRSSGDILVDVSDDNSVNNACRQYQEHYGDFDLVVLMAGYWKRMSAQEFNLETFKAHNNTNTVGMARCVAEVLPKMIARNSGTLVGVSSVAGFRGLPGSSGYGPSKAAQLNFLESLRADLVNTNVQVLSVAPGFVKTPMTDVNTFNMPFIINADRAAKEIANGIEKGKPEIIFPKRMAFAMKIARIVPQRIWPKLFRKG
jgi:short-subunit dehydrogenase